MRSRVTPWHLVDIRDSPGYTVTSSRRSRDALERSPPMRRLTLMRAPAETSLTSLARLDQELVFRHLREFDSADVG